ncbi:unnamed protein product [Mytilus edulis]|uniref:Uncharacterized protein n=1 Tax=Mytilus edulis TaxID=6550 RepID=A0A8S3T0N9_MYTED|nr:unnamed protein product [Mytilus edulis]
MYATKETQTIIDAIRAEESFEETSSAKITVSDDDMMERELERFVKNLFVTADLQCIQNHQCNIVLELEDAESDTEESENEDDIVLHVEIKNGAFKTNESLSQNLGQFISNVVTKANGKPPSCHNEVTAVLDISNKEMNSEDLTQCEEKLKRRTER